MTATSQPTGNGIGIGTVLFVVFLVLKLTGVIAWSWWWVFSPLWIPVALVAATYLIAWVLGGSGVRR